MQPHAPPLARHPSGAGAHRHVRRWHGAPSKGAETLARLLRPILRRRVRSVVVILVALAYVVLLSVSLREHHPDLALSPADLPLVDHLGVAPVDLPSSPAVEDAEAEHAFQPTEQAEATPASVSQENRTDLTFDAVSKSDIKETRAAPEADGALPKSDLASLARAPSEQEQSGDTPNALPAMASSKEDLTIPPSKGTETAALPLPETASAPLQGDTTNSHLAAEKANDLPSKDSAHPPPPENTLDAISHKDIANAIDTAGALPRNDTTNTLPQHRTTTDSLPHKGTTVLLPDTDNAKAPTRDISNMESDMILKMLGMHSIQQETNNATTATKETPHVHEAKFHKAFRIFVYDLPSRYNTDLLSADHYYGGPCDANVKLVRNTK